MSGPGKTWLRGPQRTLPIFHPFSETPYFQQPAKRLTLTCAGEGVPVLWPPTTPVPNSIVASMLMV